MNETKQSETKPEKMVSRNVAIVLGIVCIALVAALGVVGYMAYSQLSQLQDTYNGYVASHHHTDSEYASLNLQNTNLQNQVNDLNSTLNLAKSAVWVMNETVRDQPPGSWNFWTDSPTYAGYVIVSVVSSTTINTYVEVLWTSYGVSYHQSISVGVSGTGVFPVLPSNVEVRVGNSNTNLLANETVTITYIY